jgi:hypothetical protein
MSQNADYVREPETFLPERWLRSHTQVRTKKNFVSARELQVEVLRNQKN